MRFKYTKNWSEDSGEIFTIITENLIPKPDKCKMKWKQVSPTLATQLQPIKMCIRSSKRDEKPTNIVMTSQNKFHTFRFVQSFKH
jgi:hypothetical protein